MEWAALQIEHQEPQVSIRAGHGLVDAVVNSRPCGVKDYVDLAFVKRCQGVCASRKCVEDGFIKVRVLTGEIRVGLVLDQIARACGGSTPRRTARAASN